MAYAMSDTGARSVSDRRDTAAAAPVLDLRLDAQTLAQAIEADCRKGVLRLVSIRGRAVPGESPSRVDIAHKRVMAIAVERVKSALRKSSNTGAGSHAAGGRGPVARCAISRKRI